MNKKRFCPSCKYSGWGWVFVGNQDAGEGLPALGLYCCPQCDTCQSFTPRGDTVGKRATIVLVTIYSDVPNIDAESIVEDAMQQDLLAWHGVDFSYDLCTLKTGEAYPWLNKDTHH